MSLAVSLNQRTLWHTQNHSWLESTELTFPSTQNDFAAPAEQLLIQASASLISLGTERTVITHTLPIDTADRMRIPFMQGQFSGQFTYGYSLVGTVVKGPDNWLNRRVHLLHPHQQYAIVSTAVVHPLPEQLSDNTATLISNMETAVNALWDGQPSLGDRVVVFGYGLIGTLLAELLRRIPGIELQIIEPDTSRLDNAHQAGLSTSATALPETNADIIYNTATSDEAMQAAIDCAGFEGTIIDLSWHGSQSSTIELGGSFHYDRKKIISTQVSHIPANRAHRWDYASRKQLVIQLLIELQDRLTIDKTISFDNAPALFNSLRQQPLPERSVVIHYQD